MAIQEMGFGSMEQVHQYDDASHYAISHTALTAGMIFGSLVNGFAEVVNPGDVDIVTGAGSSTDNAIARWDGATGTYLQDSLATVDDVGNLNATGSVRATSGYFYGVVGSSYLRLTATYSQLKTPAGSDMFFNCGSGFHFRDVGDAERATIDSATGNVWMDGSLLVDGANIGISADDDLIGLASGVLSVRGQLEPTGIVVDPTIGDNYLDLTAATRLHTTTHMYFDARNYFYWRDADAAYAVRMSYRSDTGLLTNTGSIYSNGNIRADVTGVFQGALTTSVLKLKSTYVVLAAPTSGAMYQDFGAMLYWRDIDSAYAERMTFNSETGFMVHNGGYEGNPNGSTYSPESSHTRYRIQWFAGSHGLVQTNGSFANGVDPYFELQGNGNESDDDVTYAEVGLQLETDGNDGDALVFWPHQSGQSPFNEVAWETGDSVRLDIHFRTNADIDNLIIWAGLRETNTSGLSDDDDCAWFHFEDDANGGKWRAIHSIAATDYISDSGITVTASTWYHLALVMTSARLTYFYINGTYIKLAAALTAGVSLYPCWGVEVDGAAVARSAILAEITMSRICE